jgi:hypothetical protein
MKLEIQFIQLFLWGCTAYDKHPTLKYRRWSLNTTESLVTDQELITVYLFGYLQRRFKQKMIHCYVQGHWGACFTQLLSYQTFNHRLNLQRLSIGRRLA